MPQPVFFDEMVNDQTLMMTDTLIPTPAAFTQHHQAYHFPSKPTSTIGLEDCSLPGFEITFENDADASRLTATMTGSTIPS
jgi:hypothetical protein